MEFKRAQEIVNSPSIIEVLHKGQSVWIAGLDPNRKMAEVKENASSTMKKEVPVGELIESRVLRQ